LRKTRCRRAIDQVMINADGDTQVLTGFDAVLNNPWFRDDTIQRELQCVI
jgi:hypothetical protein